MYIILVEHVHISIIPGQELFAISFIVIPLMETFDTLAFSILFLWHDNSSKPSKSVTPHDKRFYLSKWCLSILWN